MQFHGVLIKQTVLNFSSHSRSSSSQRKGSLIPCNPHIVVVQLPWKELLNKMEHAPAELSQPSKVECTMGFMLHRFGSVRVWMCRFCAPIFGIVNLTRTCTRTDVGDSILGIDKIFTYVVFFINWTGTESRIHTFWRCRN